MSRPTIDAASAVRIVREEFGVVRRLRAARPSVAAQTPLVSLQCAASAQRGNGSGSHVWTHHWHAGALSSITQRPAQP